jgi:hypothetical protein
MEVNTVSIYQQKNSAIDYGAILELRLDGL